MHPAILNGAFPPQIPLWQKGLLLATMPILRMFIRDVISTENSKHLAESEKIVKEMIAEV